MNVRDLREALEDVPDEAVVLHAVLRHEGETIILTDADYEADENDDLDDDDDDDDGGSNWPTEEM